MTTIDPDGRPLKWIAKYWRYQSLYEEECDSLAEAINYLYWGEESGGHAGDSIIGPDGEAVDVEWDEPVEESSDFITAMRDRDPAELEALRAEAWRTGDAE